MSYLTPPLGRLVGALQKLPGIGPKSAQRLAFHILKQPQSQVDELSQALLDAKSQIHFCSICSNLSAQDPCELCSQADRNQAVICVVADSRDVLALEKTHEYRGAYHVLQGLISPMDGIGPEQLKVRELVLRLQARLDQPGGIEEVIFALSPSVEGEATTLYLSKLLRPLELRMSRIAYGLPMGGDLEFVDEVTLARAMEGRREI
ncbi:recombination protein RecR [bacterium (Candidatus Blackallbacteria) CG17_big_fil_post_rev_8_21_14_2_50_48_46]|uniref:Recombination protein RecR n=1 Tax=bacterium (Candidatus Blackallbacteria) CG17_big_fil_post_rev_8_21_14_2_50_48_46 TaxID=2014261 RepID=A0A2M7GA21_9BACT|nr:MAG: recombination protein RecR [bacterium (Candidatus Blackallbacteria) CG18_big_fil_WC_8_21_14_2_50_49_26]PIW18985.1 MAG: recombination protein RecR [bacterium (Candidatus Blackallbacteria) CG17_big_fil_post_rev_8_21_14_2_50_48_46]PIW44647.1 MAG: recombination protein RecR [bacterium (Candidatus Blackallbacteria) CG13_big_fil_rev_8_21_14_2_50_49_14]